jgi:hypothetical protein
MRSDIAPGSAFPDYQLPDHTRTLRKLSDLQGDGPLILMLAGFRPCVSFAYPMPNEMRAISIPRQPSQNQQLFVNCRLELQGRMAGLGALVWAKSLVSVLRLKSRRWRLIPQQISGDEFKVDCL